MRLGPVWGCTLAIALTMGWRVARGDTQKPTEQDATFRYDPKGRRDPFVPLVRDGRFVGTTPETSRETSKPVLYGVVWDPEGHSIALMNDQEVKVGDLVGSYRVMDIRKDAVVLSDGGEPVVLRISFETPSAKRGPGTTNGGDEP